MISREYALELLKKYVTTTNTIKHCLATAYVMEALAERFDSNKEEYYITGLLHDIDLDVIGDDMEHHALKAIEILSQYDVPKHILDAIKSHNKHKNLDSLMEKSLWISDPVNGLITATALMQPDKKLEQVKLKSLKKKFKSKSFAAGVSREQISYCETLNMDLTEFLELALLAMIAHADILGL